MRRMSSVLVARARDRHAGRGRRRPTGGRRPAAAATAVGPEAWLDALTIPEIQARIDRGAISIARAHRRLPAPDRRARRRRELDPQAEPAAAGRGGGQRRAPAARTGRAASSRASRCCSRTTSTPPTSATRPARGRCSAPARPRTRSSSRRLRAAGAVILGKANLSEWANFRGALSTSRWSARRRPDQQPLRARPQPVRLVAAGRAPPWPPRWRRWRSAPRPTARSSARPARTASSASSRPSASSAAPASSRSPRSRTPPARWPATSSTRRSR